MRQHYLEFLPTEEKNPFLSASPMLAEQFFHADLADLFEIFFIEIRE